jgi:hypothetical protein
MPGGRVVFVGEGGGGGSAEINPKDGTYTIDSIPKGNMKYAVEPFKPSTRPAMPPMPGGMPGRGPRGGPPAGAPEGAGEKMSGMDVPAKGQEGAKPVQFPDKYQDPSKSGWTTTIKGGKNTLDITVPKE